MPLRPRFKAPPALMAQVKHITHVKHMTQIKHRVRIAHMSLRHSSKLKKQTVKTLKTVITVITEKTVKMKRGRLSLTSPKNKRSVCVKRAQ